MVFSSIVFLYFFLPIALGAYFIAPKKAKNFVLLVTGLVFYAWGEPKYVLIMVLSCLIDYAAGLLIGKYDDRQKLRVLFLVMSLVMNIGLLCVFKYSSFLIDNINSIFGASIKNPKLALPIGISFFTFQSMSYTIDVYRRNVKVQKNFVSFAAFVTMFPQIVAGPIVRYDDVAKELDERSITIDKISEGIGIFLKGLSKKVILANNIGLVWTQVKAMDYTTMSSSIAWVGIIAFAFQIYFDFSGYSDMAVGLGKMLGFNFPKNFDHPYISRSISEFWRRWHITLGSWFKSYVYIPLGGNRGKLWATIRNLMITWALTGLWHGASWNFVIWGLYFGVLICVERLGFSKILEKLPRVISTAYTFVMVLFGWVLFETSTLRDCGHYLRAMLGGNRNLIDNGDVFIMTSNVVIFVLCIIGSTNAVNKAITKIRSKNIGFVSLVVPFVELALLLLCTVYLVNSTYNPFLYFRF